MNQCPHSKSSLPGAELIQLGRDMYKTWKEYKETPEHSFEHEYQKWRLVQLLEKGSQTIVLVCAQVMAMSSQWRMKRILGNEVGYSAHIGGFIGGILLTMALKK